MIWNTLDGIKNDLSMEVCPVSWNDISKAVRPGIWTCSVEVKMQACCFRDVLQERLSPYHNMVANDTDGCCVLFLNWWNT